MKLERVPKGHTLRKVYEQYGINEEEFLRGTGTITARQDASPEPNEPGKTAHTPAILSYEEGQLFENKGSIKAKTLIN